MTTPNQGDVMKAAILAFLVANKAWFVSVLGVWVLSSIVTKLRAYPDNKFASLTAAFLNLILMSMDKVSFLPAKGTQPHFTVKGVGINLPGKFSTKPGNEETSKFPAAAPVVPPAAMWWAPFIALTLMVSSCSWCVFHRDCKAGSPSKCVVDTVSQQFPHLLPIVADIFMHGGLDVNVEAVLVAEGITVAPGFLRCVIEGIFTKSAGKLAQLKTDKLATSPEHWLNSPADQLEHVHAGADAWLKKHGGK